MKKRILIINGNLRKEAAGGLVYYNILLKLSEYYELELFSKKMPEFDDLNSKISAFHLFNPPNISKKTNNLLLKNFNINVELITLKRAAKKFVKNNSNKPKFDLVLSLVAANSFQHISFGNTVAKKMNIKHFVYSVDPVPAVIGWANSRMEDTNPKTSIKQKISQFWTISPLFRYKQSLKFVSQEFSKIDFYFASNNKMLEYQLNLFQPKKDFRSGVLFTPILKNYCPLERIQGSINYFVYTGRFYGARKPHFLFNAFRKLLVDYPDSYLEIVGQNLHDIKVGTLPEEVLSRINFIGFTKDLTPFYKKATALIDIDADVEDDVYLSSKIINYLTVNRPIISQTGIESPSRELFKNMNSIIQCGQNSEDIYQAMIFTIKNKNRINTDDRKGLIEKFSVDTQIQTLNTAICQHC
jgi:glycosyltransferase involved in cell wall biosynthesis